MTLKWLRSRGIYQQLAYEYQKSGWLEHLGPGAYARAGDQVNWVGAVYAVQSQLFLPVHIGGKSALELKGYQHFVPMGANQPLYLFSSKRIRLPSWFTARSWKRKIIFHGTNLLGQSQKMGLSNHELQGLSLNVSSPERAILELLHLMPKEQSFEEARLIMEGLTGLRPGSLQPLLETCRSVKVKRLFLHLAEHCNHPWFEDLKLNKIDLGVGKRVIVPGGKFDSKYGITVERARVANEGTPDE